MTRSLSVISLQTSPILALHVTRPDAADRITQVPGQTEVKEFHVTLARLDDLGLHFDTLPTLPRPPTNLELCSEVKMVSTSVKCACYQELVTASQMTLRAYVQQCENILGVFLLDPNRVFHVTLSNAGDGSPSSSIGAVWDLPATVV